MHGVSDWLRIAVSLSQQGHANAREATQRVKKLSLQTEAIHGNVEQIRSTTQPVPVLNVSGLNVFAQININMDTNCERMTVSQNIPPKKLFTSSFKYLDEV